MDASKIIALGIYRLEAAGTQAATITSAQTGTTTLKISKLCIDSCT
jgi:hypothetical protein